MIPMSEAAELFKPDMYVVCMDSYWVRDAQMIDVWLLPGRIYIRLSSDINRKIKVFAAGI